MSGRLKPGDRLRDPQTVAGVVFVAAMFMTILDATIVNVALPAIARSFDVGTTATAAVASTYLISLGIFIPVSAWLGDRFGDKRTFLTALVVFTVASGLCGIAGSLPELIAFRFLQGVGGGMLTPVGMAMLFRAFPQDERARAARILLPPTATAPALGPVLGGFLVDQLSWRWIFFVNLPVGVAAAIFGAFLLREHRDEAVGRFDLGGFLLAGLGLAGILFALTQGPTVGWTSARVLVTGPGGIVLLAALWVHESRLAAPMLDVRLLSQRLFGSCTFVLLLGFGAFVGTLYSFSQFQQIGLGRSALEAGLLTFPEAIGVITFSRIAGRLYARLGPRRVLAGGLLGVAFFTETLALQGGSTSLFVVVPCMFGLGAAISNMFLSLQAAAFARIDGPATGHASSLYNAVRQIGAALGVSILATVIAVAGESDGGGPVTDLGAYHWAFHVAAAITLAAAIVAALGVRDAEAAATR